MKLITIRLIQNLQRLAFIIPLGLAAVAGHNQPSQAVTLWNWSLNYTNGSASGTFTTQDVVPNISTTYNIDGISGQFTFGSQSYAINTLHPLFGASNKFQWDGTSASTILIDFSGISFAASGVFVNIYNLLSGSSYLPADLLYESTSATNYSINTSQLSPVAPAPVPAPLPLFGAAAAFSAVRRLRGLSSRLQQSRL